MFIYIYIEYFKNPAFYIWIIELFYILHIEYLKLPNRYGTVLHSSLLLWRTSLLWFWKSVPVLTNLDWNHQLTSD